MRYVGGILCGVLVLSVAWKVVLLQTSQSMPDGDEAVTGLMALHILEGGEHPIYPYGVHYGAGGGLEAHLAAAVFALFGTSEEALQAVGLLLWLVNLGLVAAIAATMAGRRAAWIAAALFGLCPVSTYWSLKVAGGHLVGLAACLVLILLLERGVRRRWIGPVLPLAVLAHASTAPFVGVVGAHAFATAPSWRDRIEGVASALAAAAVLAWLAWPSSETVWNPVAQGFSLRAFAEALVRVVAHLFTPNVDGAGLPDPLALGVSILWLAAFQQALVLARSRRLWLYALAPLAILPVVSASLLAARHLLLLYPVSCIALACASRVVDGRVAAAAFGVLLVGGASLQIREAFSPVSYGAGVQSRGFRPAQIRRIVDELDALGIRHVYCLDPMLQWNIAFATRERIVARWTSPVDRIPGYVEGVDRARLAGEPVALVYEKPPASPREPQSFALDPRPSDALIERRFPRSPNLSPP